MFDTELTNLLMISLIIMDMGGFFNLSTKARRHGLLRSMGKCLHDIKNSNGQFQSQASNRVFVPLCADYLFALKKERISCAHSSFSIPLSSVVFG
jgi:hypothetical protein